MKLLYLLAFDLLGVGVALLAIPLILRWSNRRSVLERARDMHHTHHAAVPRLGGLALAAVFVATELALLPFFLQQPDSLPTLFVVVAGSLAMFLLGFWDDLKPIGARKKLLGQIVIASAVYFAGIGIQHFRIPFIKDMATVDLGILGLPVTVLWLVAMTNLINLIDGIDGLAGGICFMLMLLLSFQSQGTFYVHLAASAMAGGLLGFLWYNFPPARIYMGDGGAYFMGFLIGILTIVTSQKGTVMAALISPLFVLALPIIDTSLAIARRGLVGLPVFRADRHHIHHRLIEMGLSREKVVLWIYAFTFVFLALGLTAFVTRGQWVPTLIGVSCLIVVVCAGRLKFSRGWFSVGKVLGESLAIRQDVIYARCLVQWLQGQADRCATREMLWDQFLFAARKLGFTYALWERDGSRMLWEEGFNDDAFTSEKFQLPGKNGGTLELRASKQWVAKNGNGNGLAPQDTPSAPVTGDSKFLSLASELLAEGLVKATEQWDAEHGAAHAAKENPRRSGPLSTTQTMRREIEFVQCLKQWVEMEGERCDSIESLWTDFVFASQKTNFAAVQLEWNATPVASAKRDASTGIYESRHKLKGTRAGALVFQAERGFSNGHETPGESLSLAHEPRLFMIMSEIMADGWNRAMRNCQRRMRIPETASPQASQKN